MGARGVDSSFPSAAYVHIPFCRRKCLYCDFVSYTGKEHLFSPYVQALRKEIQLTAEKFPDSVIATINFGGGTPNILPAELLHSILDEIKNLFRLDASLEVTIEANPGLQSNMGNLYRLGFNRLSLGVQSLSNCELEHLGRMHTREEAVSAFKEARSAGFNNINIDLMYGIPSQTLDSWLETLNTVLGLEPEHVALYSLSVEEGTPFWDMLRAGSLQLPGSDLEADMYEVAVQKLEEYGFVHYEISNFAKPGFECRHNITYWKNEPYFGFGAGAVSCIEGKLLHKPYCEYVRATNVRGVEDYIRRVWAGENPVEIEECANLRTAMGETMFLGLRMLEGVSDEEFVSRFGVPVLEVFGPQVSLLMKRGLLEESNGYFRLTRKGLLLANEVFAEFVG